ncbi:hypothetical protein C0992_011788 [Termitomyces sp. T32_za158]|nr:hypothetical protein C0992_011788 [Termitomyces sp. T32_za158]
MRHVTDAAQADDRGNSFHLSIKERDGQGSLQYLNGVSEGIRLQILDLDVSVADRLAKYQTEREEILEMMKLRSAQLFAAEKELIQLKEQFEELQALLDDSTIFPTSNDFPACVESSASHMQTVQNAGTSREHQLRPEGDSFLPTPPRTPPCITEPTSFSSLSINQNTTSLRASTPSTNSGSPILAPGELTWESLVVSSLQELAILLERARNGDEQAYMTVDAIYTAARSTPEVDRTPYQKLVTFEWKPRPLSSFPCNPSTPIGTGNQVETIEVGENVPEIFVDSSGWGIGFVHNDRCMAWKLTPGWNADGRDNNWAEMVAVELGLLVIASAGFQSQTVIGPGEAKCVGRASPTDVKTLLGRQAFGLEPFVANEGDDPEFIKKVNDILFNAQVALGA